MTTQIFSGQYLATMLDAASASPRRRQHRNVHKSFAEPCQRLFNALEMDSYIPPHRHLQAGTPEMLMAIRGYFAFIAFTDQGELHELVPFGSERHSARAGGNAGVEVAAATWHTVIALAPAGILLEIKAGPFDPNAAKDLAPWAPDENSSHAGAYLDSLVRAVRDRLETEGFKVG